MANHVPDSKVHGANMGPFLGRQDPGGPHVGPMNFATWGEQFVGKLLRQSEESVSEGLSLTAFFGQWTSGSM